MKNILALITTPPHKQALRNKIKKEYNKDYSKRLICSGKQCKNSAENALRKVLWQSSRSSTRRVLLEYGAPRVITATTNFETTSVMATLTQPREWKSGRKKSRLTHSMKNTFLGIYCPVQYVWLLTKNDKAFREKHSEETKQSLNEIQYDTDVGTM